MHPQRTIFRRNFLLRTVALLACVALLYFGAGGSLLHEHTSGPDSVCHICQALHMPALAASTVGLLAAPEVVTRYCSPAKHVVWLESFSLHRAGRAPPTA
jgi:hypothetical protein